MTGASGPRWLAIFLPTLSTDRLRAQHIAPPDGPVACYARVGNAFVLGAVDARARAEGLAPGMSLADARAMRPALWTCAGDDAADLKYLDRIGAWCSRFTPVVALDPPDGLYLDVAGCAHLFGGERALMDDIAARLARKGVGARAALAPTPAAAWALARWAPGTIVAEDRDVAPALAPLPVRALQLAPESAAFLARAGLRTVGQIAAAPRAAFAARAGEHALARLDRALGRAPEALSPRRPLPPVFAARRLMEPVFHAEALLAVTCDLIADALAELDRRAAGLRDGELTFFGVDGADLVVPLRASRPERDAGALLRLVREKLLRQSGDDLDALDSGFGYEAARLDVFACGPLNAATPSLAGGAEADAAASMAALVDVLGARLGAGAVARPALVDAHMPERAEAWLGALTAKAPDLPGSGAARSDGSAPRRPLSLFAPPQPVEALALAPDGPPLRFRWRRLPRTLKRAEGPERIAGDWIAGEDTRDYWRVEDADGRRYWMFRAGDYGGQTAPRWFVHGLFA